LPKLLRIVFVTEREELYLKALILKGTYEAAAKWLRSQHKHMRYLKPGSIRVAMLNLRIRIDHAEQFLEQTREYRKQFPKGKHWLG